MAALESEVIDNKEFIDVLDYQFSGNDFTVENKRKFIEAYREEGSIHHAAIAVGISRKTAHNWINSDPQFAEAFSDCQEDTYDKAETSVFKKALAGDSLLLMFYLKAHRHKFRDKVSIDIEGVRGEIEERMNQLQLRQLPAMTTEFLTAREIDIQQFPPQPAQLQKELSDSSSK